MVGDHDWPVGIFLALCNVRKHRCQQISRARALYLERDLFAVPVAQQRQCAIRVPAPACLQQRREQRRLLQNFLHRVFMQEVKNISQRKAVLLSQGNIYAVVGGRRLQLKVE